MFRIHDKITGDFLREDDAFVSAHETIYIDDLPNMLKPKWDGEQWIETASQEEIDEMTKLQKPKPTEMDLLQAQVKASRDYMDFLEEVIVEMAQEIYE